MSFHERFGSARGREEKKRGEVEEPENVRKKKKIERKKKGNRET